MIRFSQRHLVIFVLLTGFTAFAQISCWNWKEISQRTEKAVQEVEVLQKRTPLPEEFVQESSEKTTRFGYVTNIDHYRTTDDCGSVGGHFRRYFIDEGWDPKLMSVEDVGGGMKTRDFVFVNGEIRVTVACQIDVRATEEKLVDIVFSWRPK